MPQEEQGILTVEFEEINVEGFFQILAGQNSWIFEGSSGLIAMLTQRKSLRIRYNCPPQSYCSAFKIKVKWESFEFRNLTGKTLSWHSQCID